jgi:hypothetical protein
MLIVPDEVIGPPVSPVPVAIEVTPPDAVENAVQTPPLTPSKTAAVEL